MFLKLITPITIFSLFITSCSLKNNSLSSDSDINATIKISIYKPNYVGNQVLSAKAVISASDMDTLSHTLVVTDTSVYGTIENVKAGLERKFEIFCYNEDLLITFYGYDFLDINAGQIHQLNIELLNTGTVNIGGTFTSEEADSGDIVFQADYDGNNNIYIMDFKTKSIKQLTHDGGNDYYPKISPDKSKIVFCSNRSGISVPYIMNIDGSNIIKFDILPGKPIGYCSWSNDGNQLIFHAVDDGDADIFIFDFTTERVTKLLNNDASDRNPNWSPKGDLITFFSDIAGVFRSYLCKPDGSELKLLSNEYGIEERSTIFSPDGQSMAIGARNKYAQWGIFECKIDGSEFTELLNTEGVDERYPCFSPSGTWIIYTRFDGGENSQGLYLLDIKTKTSKMLLDNAGNEEHAHWL